ncbi:hypothetical protein D3C71_1014350 [compost metagenome]
MAFHQTVEHIHVAEHQAGLLGGNDDVLPAQHFAGTRGHIQRHDLVEILAGAFAQFAGAGRVGVGQAKLGLADAFIVAQIRRRPVTLGVVDSAQHRFAALDALAGFSCGRLLALALRGPAGTPEQENRHDQQQSGKQNADAQQCHVGHTLESPEVRSGG